MMIGFEKDFKFTLDGIYLPMAEYYRKELYKEMVKNDYSEYDSKKPFEFTSYIADTTAETEWTKYNQVLAQRLGLSIAFVTLIFKYTSSVFSAVICIN